MKFFLQMIELLAEFDSSMQENVRRILKHDSLSLFESQNPK